MACRIFMPVLIIFIAFCTAIFLYKPDTLQLQSTSGAFVTSTTPSSNYFYDDTSGFQTSLELRNCTLYKYFTVGIVKQDSNGGTEGFEILESVFDELAEAYAAANTADGYTLSKKVFDTQDDLDNFVKRDSYWRDGLCFAFGWDEYEPEEQKFAFDLRWNYGDILEPRRPQTEYEESIQNQLYLPQYAKTGFLQTMTSVTSKIISDVYGVPSDEFSIQLLYMPMDSPKFQNDNFSEVVGAMVPITVYAFINLASRIPASLAAGEENRIQQMLQRAGMRKFVDMMLELAILAVILPTCILGVTWLTTDFIVFDVSYAFILVSFIVYTFNVLTQSYIIRFGIDSHVVVEAVELLFEAINIVATVQGYFMVKIMPWYVLSSAFLLPLSGMTWIIRLGIIASNKNIHVELGQPNLIVNGNDMSTVLQYMSYSLLVRTVWLCYLIPVKINNNPEKPRGMLYIFQKSEWVKCCRKIRNRSNVDEDGDDPDLGPGFDSLDSFDVGIDSTKLRPTMDVTMAMLHEEERSLIDKDLYEVPKLRHSDLETVQLDRVVVSAGESHLVNELSLTAFQSEILVLIGGNGSGKSSVLETIAGMHHVHAGSAKAYGFNLFEAVRFLKSNFLTFSPQQEILIDQLTPEQHVIFYCTFMGINEVEETVDRVLFEYMLVECANIIAIQLTTGQRKRLSLALSLLGDTKIVLLDEPTAGSDGVAKHAIWKIIKRNRRKKCIIVATQDMEEAQILGDRIALLSHGKLVQCGSPQFFANKYGHCLQLEFSVPDIRNKKKLSFENIKLLNFVKESIKEDYKDKLEPKWNKMHNLVVRLPPEITKEQLNECIDMHKLHEGQGDVYETMEVVSISFAQTFDEMSKHHGHYHDDHHNNHEQDDQEKEVKVENLDDSDGSPKPLRRQQPSEKSDSLHSSLINSQIDDFELGSVYQTSVLSSSKALIIEDFKWSTLWRQLATVFGMTLLIIGQETFFTMFYVYYDQPIIELNNIEETFEENGPPILFYANELTPSGGSTELIMDAYVESMNEEAEQVELQYSSWYSHETLTVEETLSEAGAIYFEMMEGGGEEHIEVSGGEQVPKRRLNSSGGEKEAFGAYYIYDMDEVNNNYSIGVYGNQVAAASCPSFGATMLQTLARQITQETPTLEFRNYLLPINEVLFPLHKPTVAETFGVATLAAVTFVLTLQITWHGKPLATGFHSAYISNGGFKLSYFLSKYLKAVVTNLVFAFVLGMIILIAKFRSDGYTPIVILYCFVCPLMIFNINYIMHIKYNFTYQQTKNWLLGLSVTLGVFAFLISGAVAFSQSNWKQLYYVFMFQLIYPPTVLFSSVEFGLIFQLNQILTHQNVTEVNLDPYKHYNSYIYGSLVQLCIDALVWGFYVYVVLQTKKRFGVRVLAHPLINSKDVTNETKVAYEAHEKLKQTHAEQNRDSENDFKDEDKNILIVKDLDCFRELMKEEISGDIANHSVMIVGTKGLGVYTVKNVSFTLKQTERLVILGASSSGTSHLVQSIAGVYSFERGEIWVDGKTLDGKHHYYDLHGIIGYQPQKNSIDDDLTVYQHVKIFAKLANVPANNLEQAVDAMIKDCLLEDRKHEKAGNLSHGSMRFLTLAMALIGRPRLIVLDSPVSGTDPANKTKLLQTILKYSENRALLVCTRDVQVAETLGQKIAIMHEGQIKAIGTTGEILKHHGRGLSVEVQTCSQQLQMQVPDLLEDKKAMLHNLDEANECIDNVMHKLNEQKIINYCIYREMFNINGLLKDPFTDVKTSAPYPRDQFIREILTINLAVTIKEITEQMFPSVNIECSNIFNDLITLDLDPPAQFDLQSYSHWMDEKEEELPFAFFAIRTATLDKVFSKLVEKKVLNVEQVRETIMNSKKTEARNSQINEI